MATTDWMVRPHGRLETLAENLWRVDGSLPNMALRRAMTVARMADGKLVIHNGVAVDDATRGQIEALGPIAVVVAPSGFHRMDAPAFRARYPEARLICPSGARGRVEEAVKVDVTFDQWIADSVVSFAHLDGVKQAEGVMKVRSSDGWTLVFNDLLFNHPHVGGFGGFMLKLVGSTGGPRVTRIARTFLVKDKKALRAHLERLAATPGLVRLVPGHGDPVIMNAPAVLSAVAAAL